MKAYHDGRVTVHGGDCLAVLAELPADSFDAVCVDPPYHFASIVKRFAKTGGADRQESRVGAFARHARGFMGRTWDGGQIAHEPETWAAVLRVMKPGAHLVAFHAPKNWHRLACAIEDAGFEIRDTLLYLFGSGFPKSHNVGKAIDKLAGKGRYGDYKSATHEGNAKRGRRISGVAVHERAWMSDPAAVDRNAREWIPESDAAVQFDGWGSALKPAYEPIVLARKPLVGMIAANVMKHGTGALNIDATRVSTYQGGARSNREDNTSYTCLWREAFRICRTSGNPDGALSAQQRAALDRHFANVSADARQNRQPLGLQGCCLICPHCDGEFPRPDAAAVEELFRQLGGEDRSHVLASCPIRERIRADLSKPFHNTTQDIENSKGRWPANVCHDGSDEVVSGFPESQSGEPREPTGSRQRQSGFAMTDGNGGKGDSGSAARFFATFPRGVEWTTNNASDAAEPLSLQSEAVVSVLSHAAEALMLGLALQKQSYRADSTTVTASELRTICELVTIAIQNIESAFSRESPRTKLTLSRDHVSIAAIPAPTGITTIIISLLKSNGRVDRATFAIIETSAALGVSDSDRKRFHYTSKADADDRLGSKHPTVKPLNLLQWLVRLITPPGGHVLDPFAGTGTTAEAALREGFRCTLIEREAEYLVDIDRRMAHVFDGEVGRGVAIAKTKPDSTAPAPLLDFIKAAAE